MTSWRERPCGAGQRRLLLLRLRTRFDLCFIGSLALGVLAAFRVAYVSLAAWPLSVGLLWIGYVLAVHPARYGDISLDAKIWENLYRKLLAASAVQWWALLRLVRLGRLEVNFAEMRYYDTMQAWKPLLFAVGLALLCAVLERALRRRAGADASLLWIPERLRPMLHRSGGFLRRTRRLWLVWLAWAVLLAGVALWLRLRQGVLIAGAVSGAGVLVWTLLHWKKRRPPLAEEGET